MCVGLVSVGESLTRPRGEELSRAPLSAALFSLYMSARLASNRTIIGPVMLVPRLPALPQAACQYEFPNIVLRTRKVQERQRG
jgi:hypothetical protein